ncbi:KNTC1 [Mytilus edulis]|uniref:KNTC1 n=1 Tax=Mytilus edulis TaxID=6550 RepID=A0A8S3U109_MYTED|nr:KNTC1 [Mytilus edulis]
MVNSYVSTDKEPATVKSQWNWQKKDANKELLTNVKSLLEKVSNCEMAMACAKWMVTQLPSGAEKVMGLEGCIYLAQKWYQALPESKTTDKEKAKAAVIKFNAMWRRLATEQILFLHGIRTPELHKQADKPKQLIIALYEHPCIVDTTEDADVPDIHAVVEEVANLNDINLQSMMVELLQKWLPSASSKQQDADTETGYMSPDVIQDIKQKFNKNVDFSNGVSRSTGVITIVNKDLKLFKSHRVPTPLKGRLIHNSYDYNDTVINLLNLYAPQCGLREEQRLFYDILLNYVSNVEQYSSKNKYILTGDFNFIEDKIDSNNMNCRLNKYILDKFKSIKDTLKIKDVYREIHKDKANFTCYNISGSRTRIDRFMPINEFINKISEIKHIPYKKSDHKMVQINIQYKRQKWGRGFWKMNNSLLENEKYTVLISNIIKQWKEDKLKYDPLKGWDLLKKQIKETTINFSRVQAKISKSKLN